jgi:hypothetical protein
LQLKTYNRSTKILFVNKFGPLSNAITGLTAHDLANYLFQQDIDVKFLSIRAKYRANKDKNYFVDYPVTQISSFYNGDKVLLRFISSLAEGLHLFVRSLFIQKDVIIVMTEPPLLFFWFQLFRWLYKAKLIYWTMDIYPEAFVAGKFISDNNPFIKLIRKIVYGKPPDILIALGEEQLKYLENKFQSKLRHVILPCGVINPPDGSTELMNNGKILFAYAGNLGAAHDPEFLIEFINQLDFNKHSIILSLYGTKAPYVKDLYKSNENVIFKDSLSHQDISNIDINISSLLPEWEHVCVPSKAVTAICCGSALLLNTSKDSDAWHMFHNASWIVEPGRPYRDQISAFLTSLTKEEIHSKRESAKRIAQECVIDTKRSYDKIKAILTSEKIKKKEYQWQ